MNKEKLIEVGINYDEGLKRFANKVELYEKYLNKFNVDTNFSELKNELNNKNYDEAFKKAHTLKGIVGNLSMNDLYNKVSILVESLRHKNLDNIDNELKDVEELYNKVSEALKQ